MTSEKNLNLHSTLVALGRHRFLPTDGSSSLVMSVTGCDPCIGAIYSSLNRATKGYAHLKLFFCCICCY